MGFLCVLKMYHVKLYIMGKNRVWNGSQIMWDSFQTLANIAENFLSYASKTLTVYAGMCLRMHALACVHRPRPTYVGRGPFGHFISKNGFFFSFKRLYFPF